MAMNEQSPNRVAKLPAEEVSKDSYRMARPIKFDGVFFDKGDAVEFNDDNVKKLFLRNNYII